MNYKLDVELSKELEPYRNAIEATIKPYVKIKLTDNSQATWWQSKFGGLPYMPKNFEYPKSNDGEYLYLLAQINFTEVPSLDELPDQGILQFYVAADEDCYGCDLDNPFNQDRFRVIYFPEVDLEINNLLTDFDFLPQLKPEDWLMPFKGCCSLDFTFAFAPVSFSDIHFSIFPEHSQIYDIPNNLYNQYCNLFCREQHKLCGYPNFIHQDPVPHPQYCQDEEQLILLFQMISARSKAIDIMWADGGIGNFFIKPSNLEKLDFTQVLYSWDCG